MKNFFRKNDRYILLADRLFFAFLIVYAIIMIILTIISFVNGIILTGAITLILTIISVPIMYISFKLIISYLIDIKLIRNKLYEDENQDFNIDLIDLYDK